MRMGVFCCKDCVPPKRKSGCHSTCKDYADARRQYEEDKKAFKESKNPVVKLYEFNMTDLIKCKSNKK